MRDSASNCALVVTCEHASWRLPRAWRKRVWIPPAVLKSHRGWDPGAVQMARDVAGRFHAPLHIGEWSRLLIELNRSLHHRRVWSEFSVELADHDRKRIVAEIYRPYRAAVESTIARAIRRSGQVFHLSMHTFTPVFEGTTRNADIGLLYDPRRPGERTLADQWQSAWRQVAPQVRVRRNYPYLGKADGFTTALRRRFTADTYAGIELEVNQRHPLAGERTWRELRARLVASLIPVLAAGGW